MTLPLNKVYNEDCLQTMGNLEDGSLDLVVTSPPYGSMRDYDGYSFDFLAVGKELYRTTKDGGIVVWIVGDQTIKGSETLNSFKQAIYFVDQCGFKMHDSMIFEKHNFSNPSSNRYHQIFEYMFVLLKGDKPNTFNGIKDRKNVYAGKIGSWGKNTVRQTDGTMKLRERKKNAKFGLRHNIWRYRTGAEGPLAHKHPAVFPLLLAKDMITSFTREGDVVYDPFAGSGTTLLAAKDLNRKFIGSELSKDYCANIIGPRLEGKNQ